MTYPHDAHEVNQYGEDKRYRATSCPGVEPETAPASPPSAEPPR